MDGGFYTIDEGFRNASALITGASSGIGEATARLFHRTNIHRVILIARNIEKLNAIRDELETEKGDGKRKTKVEVYQCDMGDRTQIESTWKKIVEQGPVRKKGEDQGTPSRRVGESNAQGDHVDRYPGQQCGHGAWRG